MSTGGASNVTTAVTAKPSQTELEMAAGRRTAERYARQAVAKKTNCTPLSLETIDTGIVDAVTAKQPKQAEDIKNGTPPPERSAAPGSVDQGEAPHADDAADPNASLAFLNDFFGSDKRHLVAIKKGKKSEIKAHHFDAEDRTGQQAFITDYGNAGFDLYFSPNPIKGTLHKKAKKSNVASTARADGPPHAVVDLWEAGRIQRRIWRAFMTQPNIELTTADLARWCYPRVEGEPLRKHRWAIVRAAARVATRVRRDRPGGVVFRAFGSRMVALTALVGRFFPKASAEAIAEFETLTTVALFSGLGLLMSISVVVSDQYLPGEWF